MTETYLFNAADLVRRKALSALEVQSGTESTGRPASVGVADGAPRAASDAALIEETERALAQSVAALAEIANQDRKESEQDG